jgi:hypothetical protein
MYVDSLRSDGVYACSIGQIGVMRQQHPWWASRICDLGREIMFMRFGCSSEFIFAFSQDPMNIAYGAPGWCVKNPDTGVQRTQ